MQGTLISLTEEIAAALASEFKLYLPQIIPHALKIFMYDDSVGKTVTLQVSSESLLGARVILLLPTQNIFAGS